MKSDKSYRLLLICIFFIYLFLQLPFITQTPNVMVDEPWYANVAFNFSQGSGLVNTNPGTRGGDELFLYTLVMGSFHKIFGTSLFTARLFSIIGGLIGLLGLIFVLKAFNIKKILILSGCILYIFSNINYIIFRTVRPEGWLVAFIIWAIYFLVKAIKYRSALSYFFSGLFITAAFLCHPNAVIYIFLFGLFFVFYSVNIHKWNLIINYVLGCFVVIALLIFFLFILQRKDVVAMLNDWSGRTPVGSVNILTAAWQNLLQFINTYIFGIKRLFIFVFEIGVLIFGLFQFKKNKYLFVLSLLGLSYFILAIIFLKPFVNRHFSEVLIFSIISFSLILQQFEARKILFKFFIFIGLLYFINNLVGDVYVIKRDCNKIPYSYIEQRIDEIVPDRTNVVTLMHFWFGLKNNDNYNSYTRWETKKYKSLDDLLTSGDVDYVVISDFLTEGRTGTSGRKVAEHKTEKRKDYYDKVHKFAVENGYLVETIVTNNYNDIEIWKIDKQDLTIIEGS